MHFVTYLDAVWPDEGLEGCEIKLGLQVGAEDVGEEVFGLVVAVCSETYRVGP